MSEIKYRWNNESPTYSQQYLLPVVLGLCRSLAPKTVLDVGVGNGSYLPLWLREGWAVSGMEPDADGYNLAKGIKGVDLRRLGVGSELPEDWKGAFDVVISLEVIEHLFAPMDLVNGAQYSLKSGGYVIVSTPYHGYAKNLALSITNNWDKHHHPARVGGI